jgi:rhodanese-related sulfurtransferase
MPRMKLIGAAVLLLAATGLAWLGQPSAADRLRKLGPSLDARLASEDARIDPGELFELTQNNQVRLELLDLRSEADYNQFHLTDARRVSPAELEQPWLASLPPEAVIVVMSNDEQAAEQGWKVLAALGIKAYILGGGVNLWLDVYAGGNNAAALPARGTGDDTLRHRFASALGAEQSAAHPDSRTAPKRQFTAKVKSAAAAKRPGGGCG